MIKKFLASIVLATALVIGGQLVNISPVEAADVWVYTNAASGRSVYVDDQNYNSKPGRNGRTIFASAKWVNADGSLYYQETWDFSLDEGYIWAWIHGTTNQAFPIIRAHSNNKYTVVDRPDLVALYNWIWNHGN